jgi:hypothetical protein
MGGAAISAAVGGVLAMLLGFTAPALLSTDSSDAIEAPLVTYGTR